MGLTGTSIGANLLKKEKTYENEGIIALAGSPNVGKSSVFNLLTGLNQHTGNWTGKTVTSALGQISINGNHYLLADLPGTYSLSARSKEEENARDFICFGDIDGVICVCDAMCLERNLSLVMQISEFTPKVSVCVNLIDRAEKLNVFYNFEKMSELLGMEISKFSAKKKQGIKELKNNTEKMLFSENRKPFKVEYPEEIETAVGIIEEALLLNENISNMMPTRFLSLKILTCEDDFLEKAGEYLGVSFNEDARIKESIICAKEYLNEKGLFCSDVSDAVSRTLSQKAKEICEKCVISKNTSISEKDRVADKIFTGKITAFPIMILLLMFIFFLTIKAANYPSEFLSGLLFSAEKPIFDFLTAINVPQILCRMLVYGIYRVSAYIISVMLPPMAIFFPLFTLLEDIGLLPRIAYNLDKCFMKCGSCGKQALSMCMGFGCNAAGVVGTRIIDSKRERLIAIITNNFVPCNGRFPILIALITSFILVGNNAFFSSLILSLFIILGIVATLISSSLLSKTLLKGTPSAYTLELPSYKFPNIKDVLIRSFLDRTIFVLFRAILASIPCGIIIWCFANIDISGLPLLKICTDFLNPFGSIFGLDGVILMAFILGVAANETVIPIMLMAYMSSSFIENMAINDIHALFVSNGWTVKTAICVCIFTIMHFPCTTTLITIKKETGSRFYTFISAVLPTVFGLVLCFTFNLIWNLSVNA